MLDPGYTISEEIFVTIIVLRFYEEKAGELRSYHLERQRQNTHAQTTMKSIRLRCYRLTEHNCLCLVSGLTQPASWVVVRQKKYDMHETSPETLTQHVPVF